jgi:transposase-like protein
VRAEAKPEPPKTEHTRWQLDRTIVAIRALHSPHGIPPQGTSIRKLTNRLNKLQEFKEDEVSHDTVRRAVIEIKAEAARQK